MSSTIAAAIFAIEKIGKSLESFDVREEMWRRDEVLCSAFHTNKVVWSVFV